MDCVSGVYDVLIHFQVPSPPVSGCVQCSLYHDAALIEYISYRTILLNSRWITMSIWMLLDSQSCTPSVLQTPASFLPETPTSVSISPQRPSE